MTNSDDTDDQITKQRKRLLYQSHYRGTQEADLLFGAFAARYLAEMTDIQLTTYERLLDESDVDLVNWMTGRDQPPAALHSDILSLLLNFKIPIASN